MVCCERLQQFKNTQHWSCWHYGSLSTSNEEACNTWLVRIWGTEAVDISLSGAEGLKPSNKSSNPYTETQTA